MILGRRKLKYSEKNSCPHCHTVRRHRPLWDRSQVSAVCCVFTSLNTGLLEVMNEFKKEKSCRVGGSTASFSGVPSLKRSPGEALFTQFSRGCH
jgi:hypothetical protein